MRGHIVGPFVSMQVIGRVLRHHTVENRAQVAAHIRVGVLVERQRRRCVLYQQIDYSRLGELEAIY